MGWELLTGSESVPTAVEDQPPADKNSLHVLAEDLWRGFKKGLTPAGAVESLYRSYTAPIPGMHALKEALTPSEPSESTIGNIGKAAAKTAADLIPETMGEAAQWVLFPKAVSEGAKFAVEKVPLLGKTVGEAWELIRGGPKTEPLPETPRVASEQLAPITETHVAPETPPTAAQSGRWEIMPPGGSQAAKPAPATPAGHGFGVAEGYEGPGYDRYNLTEDIPGHPAGSTVVGKTLEEAGFVPPKPPGAEPPSSSAGGPSPEPLPKYAGSINLERIDTDEAVKRAILTASEAIPKREPISLDTIQGEAGKLGYTLEDAEKFAELTQQQRANFLAARNVNTALAERYAGAKVQYTDNPTPKNFDLLRTRQAEFLRGFKATQEIASQAGLALRTYGIRSQADFTTESEKVINQLLTQLQTKGKLSDEITMRLAGLNLDNPEEVAALIKTLQTKGAPLKDKLYEAFLNSILSGPSTHAANISGNLINLGIRPFDRIGSGTIDLLRAPATGTPQERFLLEGPLDVWGMMSGLGDAARVFLRSARHGFVTYGSKIETKYPVAIGGTTGEIVRVPTKALQAEDEFFKSLSRSGSLRVMAYREAAVEGHSGMDRLAVMYDKILHPTQTMLDKMNNEALLATFQQALGKYGKATMKYRDSIEPLKYIMPFIKTPINIGKAGLSRTPLNFLELGYEVASGKLPRGGELSDELSKTLIGVGLSAWIATEVISGNVTGGGPPDKQQRANLLDTGWRPYSIKIGGAYYPYARLEPLATTVGTVADAVELMDMASEAEQKQIVQKLAQGFTKNLVDKTYLQGMAQMADALHDPGQYGEKFVSSRLSAVVPAVVAQAARAGDDEMRNVKGLLDTMQARVPVLRQDLPPKRNIYGEEIEQTGSFWSRFLSPVVPSPEHGTPGQMALVEAGAGIGPLRDTITVQNKTIKLTADEYDRYQVVAGKYVKDLVEADAGSPEFSLRTKEMQAKQLHHDVAKGREIGRRAFLAELQPDLGALP